MNRTRTAEMPVSQRMTDTTEHLAEYLGCGTKTAKVIGERAGAKITIGKRVLWNLSKIQDYLDSQSV